MAQETFATEPEVRDACAASIFGHAGTLEARLRRALTAGRQSGRRRCGRSWRAITQTVLQGAFVLSKAADDPALVTESIGHLRRYLELLLRTG